MRAVRGRAKRQKNSPNYITSNTADRRTKGILNKKGSRVMRVQTVSRIAGEPGLVQPVFHDLHMHRTA